MSRETLPFITDGLQTLVSALCLLDREPEKHGQLMAARIAQIAVRLHWMNVTEL